MHVLPGSRLRMAALIVLLFIAVALAIIFFRSEAVPRAILLAANNSFAPKRWIADQWIPMSWAWYFAPSDFPQPIKTITNLSIYFVNMSESASMHKQLTSGTNSGTACRISTGQGIHTRLFSGQSPSPSFALEVVVKRRSDCTDLRTSIQAVGFGGITNLAMAVRLQVPQDHCVFIMKSADTSGERGTLAGDAHGEMEVACATRRIRRSKLQVSKEASQEDPANG